MGKDIYYYIYNSYGVITIEYDSKKDFQSIESKILTIKIILKMPGKSEYKKAQNCKRYTELLKKYML